MMGLNFFLAIQPCLPDHSNGSIQFPGICKSQILGICFGVFAGLVSYSPQATAAIAFSDSFNVPDRLITNEYGYWNPTSSQAILSNDWEMTSGSLFAQLGTAWTGVPDTCSTKGGSPDATSSLCTNSSVFRLNTKRTFAGNTKVSFAIRQNKDLHSLNCNTNDSCWYGTHIWLRHVNQYNLYYASIQRADGKVVIKRKVPCGSDNSGTYFALSSYIPNDWSIGNWKRYSATIGTNADGSVTIKLYDEDKSATVPVVEGTDQGGTNPNWSSSCTTPGRYASSTYAPITQAGSAGVRGDYANFNLDDFTVTTDAAPAAGITSPVNGSTVSGTVKIAASTADDSQISHVDFYIDGTPIGTSTTAPYSYSWNTTGVVSGTHVLNVRAYDKAGNAGVLSPSVKVTTALTATFPVDTVAPTTSIVAPAAGSTVSGKVNVTANAADAVGVTKVEFYVNGVLKLTDTTAPYNYTWDTTVVSNGAYTLSAKAYDAAGNVGSSAALPITVANITSSASTSSSTSSGLAITTKITSQWDTGYCQSVTIKNITSSPITWQVSLPISGKLSSIWNAIGKLSGSTLVMTGETWNATLKPGALTSPGFCTQR